MYKEEKGRSIRSNSNIVEGDVEVKSRDREGDE